MSLTTVVAGKYKKSKNLPAEPSRSPRRTPSQTQITVISRQAPPDAAARCGRPVRVFVGTRSRGVRIYLPHRTPSLAAQYDRPLRVL